jgi:sortase A
MAKNQRSAEDLSIQELETLLQKKKMQARSARLQRFRKTGRAIQVPGPQVQSGVDPFTGESRADVADEFEAMERPTASRRKTILNRALLGIEIVAVLGLGYILLSGFGALRSLNQEVAEAMAGPIASPTPIISAVVLPSGHTPPTSPGGAQPNDAEIPEHLRPLIQSMPAPILPTVGPSQAQRIFIPELWTTAAPVVQGDGWEQLKKGVGQHLGTANPGNGGNLVLSAHNDIFGELFRDLDQLEPGDAIIISTAAQDFTYRVTGLQIVEPTDVAIMEPTSKPTITLISCYPYLVDNQRIAVFGELVEG